MWSIGFSSNRFGQLCYGQSISAKERERAVSCGPFSPWALQDGRFYDAGLETVSKQIETGAEQFNKVDVSLAGSSCAIGTHGCMVFHYDMIGYADANQLGHRPEKWKHLDRAQGWGFMSVQADLRLQNMMGLQTWNSIRAVDFVLQLDDVDPSRVGVTGASGGGTQSMILGAIDERIAASMPCVMVSTAMQGGCTCENAPLLRIDQGNIDIAAATAPRPLGLTAADDWTIDLKTRGFPDLENIYQMMGVASRLSAVFTRGFLIITTKSIVQPCTRFLIDTLRLGMSRLRNAISSP